MSRMMEIKYCKPHQKKYYQSSELIVEFIIIQLIYVRERRRKLMMTRKKNEPNGAMGPVADWYNKNLEKERSGLKAGTKENFREWRIYTGDETIFRVDGVLYDQIYIFMGARTYNWIFFRDKPKHVRRQGTCPHRTKYCGCCVFTHVSKILKRIKSSMRMAAIPEE